MCLDCVYREVLGIGDDDDYDASAIPWPEVTDEMQEAARLVSELYEWTAVGGPLHITTDDFNLGDDHLAFCRSQLPCESIPEVAELGRRILDLLDPMTVPQRATALAVNAGWYAPPNAAREEGLS